MSGHAWSGHEHGQHRDHDHRRHHHRPNKLNDDKSTNNNNTTTTTRATVGNCNNLSSSSSSSSRIHSEYKSTDHRQQGEQSLVNGRTTTASALASSTSSSSSSSGASNSDANNNNNDHDHHNKQQQQQPEYKQPEHSLLFAKYDLDYKQEQAQGKKLHKFANFEQGNKKEETVKSELDHEIKGHGGKDSGSRANNKRQFDTTSSSSPPPPPSKQAKSNSSLVETPKKVKLEKSDTQSSFSIESTSSSTSSHQSHKHRTNTSRESIREDGGKHHRVSSSNTKDVSSHKMDDHDSPRPSTSSRNHSKNGRSPERTSSSIMDGHQDQPGKEHKTNKENKLERDDKEKNKKNTRVPLRHVLDGVVFVLSGFENPLRSEIRDKAIEMGASYSSKWTKDCTHLICAFPNTPKYNEVKKLNGRIVQADWIQVCHANAKRMEWRNYMMGTYRGPDTPPPSKDQREEEEERVERKQTKSKESRSTSKECDYDSDVVYELDTEEEDDDEE